MEPPSVNETLTSKQWGDYILESTKGMQPSA